MTRDVDFKQIASRLGGPREAFEELCCQLARRTIPENATYARLRGAGGDGGIECFADISNDDWIGWQAKYVFDVASLLKQASRSLETALRIHLRLNRYIVCFPFDLTGPTHRGGMSGLEKFDKWRRQPFQSVRSMALPRRICAQPHRSDSRSASVRGRSSRLTCPRRRSWRRARTGAAGGTPSRPSSGPRAGR